MATKVTPEQVKQDLLNVLAVLRALSKVMPGKVDEQLISALEAVESNEYLVVMLCHALQRL